MFCGRKKELAQLKSIQQKKTASLVAISGRRRIGKSTLVQHYSESFSQFIEIQGLAPAFSESSQDRLRKQLRHFSLMLSKTLNSPRVQFDDWEDAFSYLAEKTEKNPVLIFLDEISWMADGDKLWSSKLKNVWDLKFKKNKRLILIICGSVSTWIQKNIICSTNFVGRISLHIHLNELHLNEAVMFWKSNKNKISTYEKLRILALTGGIPKYLEECTATQQSENQLIDLCFNKNGFLNNEFDKIFSDIFGTRRKTLEMIVRQCLSKKITPAKLAKNLHKNQNSDFSENLKILEDAGFIARDYYYKINQTRARLSQIRLKDNYLRFYLKYVEPEKNKKIQRIKKFTDLKGFDATLGLQFENLIFNNLETLLELIGLQVSEIQTAGPYIQKKSARNNEGCQIDLLIQCPHNSFYLCEIKSGQLIDRQIIAEIQKKSNIIQLPRRSSLRNILIYAGELYPPHKNEIQDNFYKVIHLDDFFDAKISDS